MEYAHVVSFVDHVARAVSPDPAGEPRLRAKGNGNDEDLPVAAETASSPEEGLTAAPEGAAEEIGARRDHAPRPARGAATSAMISRTRSCAAGPSSTTTAAASSAIAAPRRPRRRPGSCGRSSAPWTTSSGRSPPAARTRGCARASSDASRAAGPARLAGRHGSRPPRGEVRPGPPPGDPARAGRRLRGGDGGGGLPEGVHVQGPAAPARARQGRERRVAGGRRRRRGRAVRARREKERGSQWER